MSTILSSLRLRAINQRRKQLFGDSSLKVYSTTPADGETLEHTFTVDWRGRRVWGATAEGVRQATSAWQFEISALSTWATDQSYMLTIVVVTIGDRRFKVTKVEKPVGTSLVWKVKAQEQ